MKPLFTVTICLLGLVGCKKNPELPSNISPPLNSLEIINLNNKLVTQNPATHTYIDIDKDNRVDIGFETILIGDFINKVDKLNFNILTNSTTAVPVNTNEQIVPLTKGDSIPIRDFNYSEWFVASEITLKQHNEFANGVKVWRGLWLDVEKRYLPFQILKSNKIYCGWVLVSSSSINKALILHQIAISKVANQGLKTF